MKLINILFIILLIGIITCHSVDEVKQIVLDEDTNFVVTWFYTNDTITFELEGEFKGWFAFGFSCQTCDPNSMEAMMGHPDMVAVTFDSNGIPTLYDMIEKMDYSPYQQMDINIGGADNILRYGGYQLSDRSLISYTRKFITDDTVGDYDIDITKDFSVTWYIGKDNTIDFDYPLEIGTNNFNLETGEVVQGGTGGHSHGANGEDFGALFAWHAALMGIAFGFLIPFGIFSSRYLKSFSWGFYLHVAVQSIALSFIIVGFILIIIAHDGEVEVSPHGILGIILFLLTCLVACGGLLSAFWKSSSPSDQPPIFPHKIHGFFGKVIALVSIATIITGLNQYLAQVAFIIIYSILVLSYFLIGLFMEIFKRFNSTSGGDVGLEKFN